jgi:hypothetical protein
MLHATNDKKISWQLLRLMDFYYLFPGQLKNIKPWPREIGNMKSKVTNIPDQFEDLTNPSRTFFELEEFQKTAILELIAKGVVSKVSFSKGIVKAEPGSLSLGYDVFVKDDDFLNSAAFKVITQGLTIVKLTGPNGLKSRSGVMEYIYDL